MSCARKSRRRRRSTRTRTQAIQRGLAKVTGRTVKLATKVDPAIIGGMVARIGSTVYDASVTRQLERMKEKLETA